MSALLEVQGLETAYGSSQVLFGIDLQVESGQVATLLGRNGMGKTTTVRSMLGLTRSKGGTVRFRGERIDQLGADRIARMGLAVVPEGRQIFPNLSVEENLRAFAANRNATKEPWISTPTIRETGVCNIKFLSCWRRRSGAIIKMMNLFAVPYR